MPYECTYSEFNVRGIIIEYFYETDKFIVGGILSDNITCLTEFSHDMNYTGVDVLCDSSFFF